MYTVDLTLLLDGKEIRTRTCNSLKEAREFLAQIENAFMSSLKFAFNTKPTEKLIIGEDIE